jgi:hypothetical protein
LADESGLAVEKPARIDVFEFAAERMLGVARYGIEDGDGNAGVGERFRIDGGGGITMARREGWAAL